jgi:hypothetical protein
MALCTCAQAAGAVLLMVAWSSSSGGHLRTRTRWSSSTAAGEHHFMCGLVWDSLGTATVPETEACSVHSVAATFEALPERGPSRGSRCCRLQQKY